MMRKFNNKFSIHFSIFSKTITKVFIFLILFVLLVGFNSVNVNAVGISVTKAVLEYNDVLKGGYAEDMFYVSTDAQFNVPLSYELLGDIKDWIKVDPDINSPNITFYVNNSNYQTLHVIVNPPKDIPAGTYSGTLRVITGTLNTPDGQYGSQLQAAFMVRISVKVTGTEFLSCNGGGVIIRDTEVGSLLDYSMSVSNGGNIRVKPTATIDIWNQDQTKLMVSRDVTFSDL